MAQKKIGTEEKRNLFRGDQLDRPESIDPLDSVDRKLVLVASFLYRLRFIFRQIGTSAQF